ncbi:hypothetical protein BDW68DRAFT_182688 [Aspergillus falconensis]
MGVFLYNYTMTKHVTGPRSGPEPTGRVEGLDLHRAALPLRCRAIHPAPSCAPATVTLSEPFLEEMVQPPWVDPSPEPCRQPAPGDPRAPGLPVYQGYGCPYCPYIGQALKGIQNQRHEEHKD